MSLEFYHGFLFALREHTERFPIIFPKYHPTFVEATKGTSLECRLGIHGESHEAETLLNEGMTDLIIETGQTYAYYKGSYEDFEEELNALPNKEIYKEIAHKFREISSKRN